MEFNQATGKGYGRGAATWNQTAQQVINDMYESSGYKMPQIVYWNIQSRNGGVPVAFDAKGTALVSGFSPAIMKSLLGGDIESPQQIMDKTIMSERYAPVVQIYKEIGFLTATHIPLNLDNNGRQGTRWIGTAKSTHTTMIAQIQQRLYQSTIEEQMEVQPG